MRTLLSSDFFLRFVGGFALGAVAVIGLQPGMVASTLTAALGTAAHIVHAV